MSSRPSQVLIIGAGVFGASTTYHLQSQINPPKVTLVDLSSYGDPTGLGASVDANKIIRTELFVSILYGFGISNSLRLENLVCMSPRDLVFNSYPPPLSSSISC